MYQKNMQNIKCHDGKCRDVKDDFISMFADDIEQELLLKELE